MIPGSEKAVQDLVAEAERQNQAYFEAGRRQGMDEALPQAFADCEALVAAGLLELAEKEDEKAKKADRESDEAYRAYQETAAECDEYPAEIWIRWKEGELQRDLHAHRAACLREMSLAVSLGQFRSAEVNEKAVVRAHREAAGFNQQQAGGEARAKALSPERRREIAAAAGRARKEHGRISRAQHLFLERLHDAPGQIFHLADASGDPAVLTPQQASAWWRTGRALAKKGLVSKISGLSAYQPTDAARARWAKKGGNQ